MGILTTLAILAAITGTGVLGGALGASKSDKNQRKESIDDFKNNFPEIAGNMTDAEIKAFLESSYGEGTRVFDKGAKRYDMDAVLQDYEQWQKIQSQIGQMPGIVNYDDIARQAEQAIKDEDAGLLQMFERDAQEQMADNNQAYGQMQRQILSNDYQKNAQLMGTVGSQMSKARQSALEAGASAGARLAGNINTLLSVQNRQSQQSLDTSNNLAQMMLNQRQAAMGIKSNLSNQRANVMGGQLNRISGYQSNRLGMEQNLYDARMQNWEDQFSAAAGTNPFQDYYRRQQQQNRNGY